MSFLTSRFKNKLMKFKYINIRVNIEAIENIYVWERCLT